MAISECTEVTREERPFLQPSESSQVCLCLPTWFRPLRNYHLDCISFAHSSLVPGLFLSSSQNPSCAFLPCSSQHPLLSCSLPNPHHDSLRFSFPPRRFQKQLLRDLHSCWNNALSPPCRTLPWLRRPPVTQEQIQQTLICYPGVLQD